MLEQQLKMQAEELKRLKEGMTHYCGFVSKMNIANDLKKEMLQCFGAKDISELFTIFQERLLYHSPVKELSQ